MLRCTSALALILAACPLAAQFATGMKAEDVLPRADSTAVDTAQITVAAQLTELLFRRPEGVQWTERLRRLCTELMRSKDPAIVRHATLGMAKMHVYDGTRKLHQGDLIASLDAYTEGLRLAGDIHDTLALAVLHNDMGMLYEDAKDMTSAAGAYRHSIRLSQAVGNTWLAAHTTDLLADIYLQQDHLDSALVLLRSIAGTDSILGWYLMHQEAGVLLRMGDTSAARSLHVAARASAERVGGDMLRPIFLQLDGHGRIPHELDGGQPVRPLCRTMRGRSAARATAEPGVFLP